MATIEHNAVRHVTGAGSLLPYAEHGPITGVPIVTLHGGIDGDSFVPLLKAPALARYRLIQYRRRPFLDPPNATFVPTTIVAEARDALSLMDHADIGAAHLVGHSYGALVAVELARRYPRRVLSLALLETGLIREIASAPRAAVVTGPIHRLYQEGHEEQALDAFAAVIFGQAYAAARASMLPTADRRRKLADARGTFEGDLCSLDGWSFREASRDIRHPVLSLLGELSDASFTETLGFPAIGEVREAVSAALPQCEHRIIKGVNHLLHVAAPDGVAEELASFYSRLSA